MRFSRVVCSSLDLATDPSCEKADIVPPDIIEELSSSDIIAREGTNVTLKCAAKGRPEPKLSWCRKDYKPVGTDVIIHEGNILKIKKASRLHMGVYFCVASNGVAPAVSRRITLQVNFPPTVWIPNQLIGANLGSNVTLECNTESYPESINYWTRHESGVILPGGNYDVIFKVTTYGTKMMLTIRHVVHKDYGVYLCFAQNSLGATESTILLYATGDVDPNYREDRMKVRESDEKLPTTFIKIFGKEEVIDSGNPGILCGIFQVVIFILISLVTSALHQHYT
ncbi:lachesin [Trichonephila clavata]|uniref:Lachesin n=1 Tax=Trichonephila clavata TaxID=2740835 RepID=A0A8X6GW57_TRICU|nr:lachesin [Trichonephila clavata]